MINMLELKFINEFIVNEKKDRLIYEFSNPQKRENAIMRFSHKVENIVNDKFIQCRCNMGNLSNNLALSGDVYIVSLEKIYGETCPYNYPYAQILYDIAIDKLYKEEGIKVITVDTTKSIEECIELILGGLK